MEQRKCFVVVYASSANCQHMAKLGKERKESDDTKLTVHIFISRKRDEN